MDNVMAWVRRLRAWARESELSTSRPTNNLSAFTTKGIPDLYIIGFLRSSVWRKVLHTQCF
jgi:hypothetical protein